MIFTSCYNCLYYHEKDHNCHNTESAFYQKRVEQDGFFGKCKCWEHFREFEHEERRRLKHGTKR